MKVRIEKLKLKSFHSFYKFLKNFILNDFLDYPPTIRRFFWRMDFNPKTLKEEFKGKEKIALVAKNKKKVLGFSLVRFERGGGADCLWVGVDKNYQGQGIGTRLLKEVEKIALKKKCHFVYLYTENKKNIEWYQKRGYYLVGLQKEAWCGMDEYLMQKNLGKPFTKAWQGKKGNLFDEK